MQPAKRKGSTLGSSSSTERGGFKVARLGRPHGLNGFLGLYVDVGDLVHFEPGSHVLVQGKTLTVRDVRKADRGYQVAFQEINDRDAADTVRGSGVYVESRRQLGEGEFWPEDLIGLEVRPGGGLVAGVEHGPAQDRLRIERDGAVFEVPFVAELVPVVNLREGFVEIVELEGLSPP